MKHLDDSGRLLLKYLVDHLPKARPGNPATFVGYKEAHEALRLPLLGPSYGVSLQAQGLNSLANWTVAHGLPAITGLIVDRSSHEPGDGYFKLFGSEANPYKRWATEIAQAKEFDWSSYVKKAGEREGPVISADHDHNRRTPHIWRLIAHHEHPKESLDWMISRNIIAVGWSEIGDLSEQNPQDAPDIGRLIRDVYPDAGNSAQGGPSLWNLYREVQIGDTMIVSSGDSRRVFEIVGDYFFSERNDGVVGYQHQRAAMLTSIDGDQLWNRVGRNVEPGQNVRWTLARCQSSGDANRDVYTEGTRFDVRSTAVERNPQARLACISHYGWCCFACGFDFAETYGDLGADFIHVHHRKDIAMSSGIYVIDPIEHLVPLCPNCHAMVHRERPAMSVEALQNLIQEQRR